MRKRWQKFSRISTLKSSSDPTPQSASRSYPNAGSSSAPSPGSTAVEEGGRSYLGRSALCFGFETEVVARRPGRKAEVSRGHSRWSALRRRPEHWKDAEMWRARSGYTAENPGIWPLERRERVKPGRRRSEGPKLARRTPLSKSPARVCKTARAQTSEPPYTDLYVRWCGWGGAARLPPIPIQDFRWLSRTGGAPPGWPARQATGRWSKAAGGSATRAGWRLPRWNRPASGCRRRSAAC